MRGKVDVRERAAGRPGEPTAPGRPFVLTGRAALPAGADVRLESDVGDGFRDVGTARVGADGTLLAAIAPTASASYRVGGSATDESNACRCSSWTGR